MKYQSERRITEFLGGTLAGATLLGVALAGVGLAGNIRNKNTQSPDPHQGIQQVFQKVAATTPDYTNFAMANGIDGKDGKKLSWIVVGEKSAFTGFTPVYDTNGALISLRTEYGKAKAEADDKAAKKVAARRPAPPTNLRVVDDSHSIRLEVPQLPTQP